jgi:hypothetical protein
MVESNPVAEILYLEGRQWTESKTLVTFINTYRCQEHLDSEQNIVFLIASRIYVRTFSGRVVCR